MPKPGGYKPRVYGLGLWLPELFVRFKQYNDLYPNETITVKKLSTLNEVKNFTNLTCEPSFDPVVIQGTIAMAVSSVLYNLISGFFTIKFQVKSISAASMVLGAVSAGCIYWLESTFQNVAVACIFQASMVTANMTIGSIGVDLFPTKVSAVALCLIICAGRIGAACSNIIFGYLIEEHCEIPIFTVAAVVLLGAALCFIIPEKTNPELINTSSIYDEKTIEVAVIS